MVDLARALSLELTATGLVEPRFLDAMGHMNVTWYLYWFDQGIWSFFERHGLDPAYLARARRGCFALEDHLRYVAELREGEALEVRTGLIEVRPKNLLFVQAMVAPRLAKVAATREVVAVHIDLDTRRSTPFADEIRAGLSSALAPEIAGPLTDARARSFAQAWIDAWNRRDIEAVLAHYADDAVFVSPRAERVVGRTRVEGKSALRAYWQAARERLTTLELALDQASYSARTETLTVLYTATLGEDPPRRAAEIMRFRGTEIVYGEALYGA